MKNQSSFLLKKYQRGLTLIEVLLVMVIIAVIAIVTFRIYNNVHSSVLAKETSNTTSDIVQNINHAFQNQNNYANLNPNYPIANGLVPQSWINSGQVITPWGGHLTFSSQTLNGVANAGLALQFSGVTQKICSKLALDLNNETDPAKINVGSTTVKNIYQTTSQDVVSQVTPACDQNNQTLTVFYSSPSAVSGSPTNNTSLGPDNGNPDNGPPTTAYPLPTDTVVTSNSAPSASNAPNQYQDQTQCPSSSATGFPQCAPSYVLMDPQNQQPTVVLPSASPYHSMSNPPAVH